MLRIFFIHAAYILMAKGQVFQITGNMIYTRFWMQFIVTKTNIESIFI